MREPCETGYSCQDCGRVYDWGPGGAWWWSCECGGLVSPRTQAEAEATQERLFTA